MHTKILSIITVNRNNAAGLEKTIQSVICQTFTDFEYIIIDGASDDNSVEIIKKYADKINFWVSEPDTGIYNAMNKGIRKAQGKYCFFLNSGDWLISSETLDNVFIEIGDNSSPVFFTDRINNNGTTVSYPHNLSINYLFDNPISHQNSIIKSSLFNEHGYYNEDHHISSDWEFFLKELWIHKTAFVHLKTNISIFDVNGIGSQESPERLAECMTVYQNVFHELTDTIIEAGKYHKTVYYDIVDKYGNSKLLTFLLRTYRFTISRTKKVRNRLSKIKKYLSRIFSYINKLICYFLEMIISIFDKRLRICFTNFQDVPHDFFLLPLSKTLELNSRPYKTVKYFNPHIQFFSVFGKRKSIVKSKALFKIFYSGENTNNPINNEDYKGNCIENVSLSFGFDYTEADNYLRFPLWLMYYFSANDSKDIIRKKLSDFKKRYQKYKFCALVASHDRSGIRTKIYNEVSKIGYVDCPGNLLHNDDTLHKRYNNNKAVYLQQYKFNICPENSISPGYVTEKLFESLYSGCIPIYNGWSKNVEPDIVNPDIIIWHDMIDEIRKINSDGKLYRSFVEQPFFCDTAVDKIYIMLQQFIKKMQYATSESLKNYL